MNEGSEQSPSRGLGLREMKMSVAGVHIPM